MFWNSSHFQIQVHTGHSILRTRTLLASQLSSCFCSLARRSTIFVSCNDTFRSQKVIDLARFVDVNFDERTCLCKPQISELITLVNEYVLEFKVWLGNQPHLRAELQTNVENTTNHHNDHCSCLHCQESQKYRHRCQLYGETGAIAPTAKKPIGNIINW